ncbi:aromatic ring-hydroxylating oxygenase subunit alpha [Noviherbaspirillum sedimenti]|uniref:Aromatic ring-hydroxylating dioxygenase subunit alpha n=1 Tax=Noviherbaspirillum sedimenti TaxID=2320865 RepID=A0A3A3GQX7_9BURK|nr:aromatic ring-hydroxylating dioxygenase subunit alpha [Noviherbaspirillum sedimenti]RJG03370.1 aromatic ring-hydroxylating dioxygenase subunit alpha [Noviherbaspirillum sedimenti]
MSDQATLNASCNSQCNESGNDWTRLRRESGNALRKRTIDHIKASTTDLAEGTMQVELGTYTDSARHEQEKRVLFRQRPVLAALTGDMPEPGDTFLFDEVGPPILLVRNKAGKVNAFLNMCTHRAAKLVTEPKRKNRMSCKFHGWTFDLDGKLVGVPGKEGFKDINLEERNLIPVPVAEWHGLIFVRANPDGAPIDVEEHLGKAFARELAHLELEKARPMKTSRIDVNSNWKYAMDTYGEGYHFGTLHPSSIGALAMSNIMSYDNYGPNHRLAMPRAEFLEYSDKPEEEWPDTTYNGLYYIFPNVVINANSIPGGRQFYGVARLFPGDKVDQGTTLLSTYKPGHMEDKHPETEPWTEMHDFIHKVVSTEDYSVSEDGQRNMKYAPASFKPVLGANELALQNIHRHINELLEQDSK